VTGARTQQKGKSNAFSANQRGRDVQKAGNRGAQSRQPMAQQRTQSRQPVGQSRVQGRSQGSKSFGGISSGGRTKQFSGRGASSRQTMRGGGGRRR
jgi:hypothetical protein